MDFNAWGPNCLEAMYPVLVASLKKYEYIIRTNLSRPLLLKPSSGITPYTPTCPIAPDTRLIDIMNWKRLPTIWQKAIWIVQYHIEEIFKMTIQLLSYNQLAISPTLPYDKGCIEFRMLSAEDGLIIIKS